MSVQARRDITNVPFIRSGDSMANESGVIKQDAGRSAVLAPYTVMGKSVVTVATPATADAGNTGNGTVTAVAIAAGGPPMAGAWNLEVTEAKGIAVSATADAGNTGNGTVTGFAISATGDPAIPGSYILTCVSVDDSGVASNLSMVSTGTGNGTAGAVTAGTHTIAGAYIITCIDATVSGSEIFEVIDPNGDMLENLTVGVAYLNDHFGVTISDGGTDFIVGDFWTNTMQILHGGTFKLTDPDGVDIKEDIALPGTTGGTIVFTGSGITFTITDGATDFAIDDFFTLLVTGADFDKFKLENPAGTLIKNDIILPEGAGTAVVINCTEAGLIFTITDGATDFIVGDKFAITVTADSDFVPLEVDAVNGGQSVSGIYLGDEITAAKIVAADVPDSAMLVGSNCTVTSSMIIFDDGVTTLDTVLPSGKTVRDELSVIGIFAEATTDIDSFET